MVCSSLQKLLAPHSEDRFLDQIWSKEFLRVKGNPAKFEGLFAWADLNSIIESHRLSPPRLRLEHDGKHRDELNFLFERPSRRGGTIPRVNVPRLYELLRQGATLVVDAVEETHPPLRELARNLSSIFGQSVQINLYASWSSIGGFGLHWDDHDVMIVQLDGSKSWKVYGQTRASPMYRDVSFDEQRPTGPPIWDGIVEAGDFLYIPRGNWHDVLGVGEPTLHLTIGSTNPTGVDLFGWIADELRSHDAFRKDLPIFASEEKKKEHSSHLAHLFNERLSAQVIDEYLDHRRAALDIRPQLSLPDAILTDPLANSSDAFLQIVPSCWVSRTETREGNVILFRSDHREWKFSPLCEPILQLLFDRKPHSLAELCSSAMGKVEESDVRAFVEQLIIDGIVSIKHAQA